MSSNLSKINRVVSEPESYSEQIQLNEIMQYSLQRLQQQKKNLDIIVRCQSLPTIEADKKNIVKVFDHLVQMIVSYPPTGTRLFLYVDCEEENKETAASELVKKNKRYRVNIHTNINTDDVWKTAHQKTIAECKAILAQYGAGFTVNEIRSAGCLFSISLLGKM
jgi:hypothetical protein